MTSNDPHLAIEAVWRIESAKLIAALTRMTQDVGLAEDFAQEALVAALQQWPASGFPPKPGAWLMAAAKYRVIDHFRRDRMLERKHLELGIEREELEARVPDFLSAMDDYIEDDLLRLIFIACHPVLTIDSRAALTLRLLCGLTTEEIARAFLTTESTIAQRIVRAKKTLSESQVPFAVPRGPEFETRLNSVLQVIYLIFNEGYTATSGPDLIRDALCEEALRLGRILATLAPEEPEVFGLVSLIEIQSSRNAARINDAGDPILLLDQDRLKWDRSLFREASLHSSAQRNSAEQAGYIGCRLRLRHVMLGRARRQKQIGQRSPIYTPSSRRSCLPLWWNSIKLWQSPWSLGRQPALNLSINGN